MASLNFTNRFKNKIDKIGKEGLPVSGSLRAIEKLGIPDSKVHIPMSRLLPTPSKLMISSKGQKIQIRPLEKDLSEPRSLTPYKIFPLINRSPLRSDCNSPVRSLSPLQQSYNGLYRQERNAELTGSCVKLPRVNSGLKSIRMNMKRKLNFLDSGIN